MNMTKTIAGASVIAVAAVGATVSFIHLTELSRAHGEDFPQLIPISVEGTIVSSSMVLLSFARQGRRAPALAWFGLVLGILATLVGNIVAAEPTAVARTIAAWPAVAFVISYELLLMLVRPVPLRQDADQPVSAPTAVHAEVLPEPLAALPEATAVLPEVTAEPMPDAAAEDPRTAALDLLRSGERPTGKQLGARFSRSERWGRDVISTFRAEMA